VVTVFAAIMRVADVRPQPFRRCTRFLDVALLARPLIVEIASGVAIRRTSKLWTRERRTDPAREICSTPASMRQEQSTAEHADAAAAISTG